MQVTKKLTNTESLIKDLEAAITNGHDSVNFYVGKYTGNGTSVVSALRKRGFTVDRIPSTSYYSTGGYRLMASDK